MNNKNKPAYNYYMAGGLINLASSTTNDIYLTGSPQITFFKFVHRRYTNFATESAGINFENELKFGAESELIPPRIGDLIHRGYIKIHLPSFCITRNEVGIDTSFVQFDYTNDSVATYKLVHDTYMQIMTNIYSVVYNAAHVMNVSYINLINDVTAYVNEGSTLTDLTNYDELLTTEKALITDPNDILNLVLDNRKSNLWTILQNMTLETILASAKKRIDISIDPNTLEYYTEINKNVKNIILETMKRAIDMCKLVQEYFFAQKQTFIKKSNLDKATNVRFAWVNQLGYSMIDYVDIYIGGKQIDRHMGIWLNIWHQLTYVREQESLHNKMIGDVEEMTSFNADPKPAYDIYIPLSFWFNKFNGSSFPLIAMQYNDIRIDVKLRKLEDVAYIEKIYRATVNGSSRILTAPLIDFLQNRYENSASIFIENIEEITTISLTDIWNNQGKELNGQILLDYVYLDTKERKKFAQSGHEYLVEILQNRTWNNLYQTDVSVNLDFLNPSKELVWVAQKNINYINPTCFAVRKWNEFSTGVRSNVNPVVDASITFNNYARISTQTGSYYDTFLPYTFHQTSPNKGINIYNFALFPRQFQPSGTANFSKLSNVQLFMTLDAEMFNYKAADNYPYDLDIDFVLTISDVDEFLGTIDYEKIKRYVASFEVQNNPELLAEYAALDEILTGMKASEISEIRTKLYSLIFFKTDISLTVFSLTTNILRLISGYGGLAFSSI